MVIVSSPLATITATAGNSLLVPLVAVPNAQGQVGFVPWSYLANEDEQITVSKEYIVYVIDARDEIVENYEKIFSPIQTPSKKLILK